MPLKLKKPTPTLEPIRMQHVHLDDVDLTLILHLLQKYGKEETSTLKVWTQTGYTKQKLDIVIQVIESALGRKYPTEES